MFSLDEIKKPIKNEMELFEKKFQDAMRSKAPLLDKIMHYIVKRKGKQMRPMFVFFLRECAEELQSPLIGRVTNRIAAYRHVGS